MKKQRLFDSKCYDLAEMCMADEGAINTEENRRELAAEIQAAIECTIQGMRDRVDRKAVQP